MYEKETVIYTYDSCTNGKGRLCSLTDKTGSSSFEFFNSDGTGTYRAIIEGIDKDGNIGRYIYRYKVQ